MSNKKIKKKGSLVDKIKASPINFFSDLFIVAMVIMWIVDNIYESIIATTVTISSIILSFQTGTAQFEVSMWSSIGSNVAIPLGAGGCLWLVKCGVQHAIANYKGKSAHMDFPKTEPESEFEEIELEEESIIMESD